MKEDRKTWKVEEREKERKRQEKEFLDFIMCQTFCVHLLSSPVKYVAILNQARNILANEKKDSKKKERGGRKIVENRISATKEARFRLKVTKRNTSVPATRWMQLSSRAWRSVRGEGAG